MNFTIDTTIPTLSRLLDLITRDCWTDMEWDDMEAIADRANCAFYIGASKGVFIHADWDFVVKIPYYGEGASHDYCEDEVAAYEEICAKYPLCAPLFVPAIRLGVFGEIPVYAQKRVNHTLCELRDVEPKYMDELYNKATDRRNNDDDFDAACVDASHARLRCEFAEMIVETFGAVVLSALVRWIIDTKQNDLHENNVGITANRLPAIFDFSGWYD